MDVSYDLRPGSCFTRYLDGSRFDENMRISFAFPRTAVPNRIDVLQRLSRDKAIVHLGFCDHVPLLDKKISENQWLHGRLRTVARRCVGVDINERAVELVRSRYLVDDIYAADMTGWDILPAITTDHWDALIIGEVLEHVGNPVDFLTRIRQTYAPHIDRVVITVPNAFRIGNFLGACRAFETINSDHRFFFTPYTLTKIVYDAGLHAEQFIPAQFSIVKGARGRLKRWVLKWRPLLCENLILIARTNA
jgi:hypothetical protein